mmetsp:Transcript_6240/g.15139  ORF Transcript_6240/g.15139 Transcript_6240/m.15139 type:complete len:398 (+) Transcript_6240:1963-3156(+)
MLGVRPRRQGPGRAGLRRLSPPLPPQRPRVGAVDGAALAEARTRHQVEAGRRDGDHPGSHGRERRQEEGSHPAGAARGDQSRSGRVRAAPLRARRGPQGAVRVRLCASGVAARDANQGRRADCSMGGAFQIVQGQQAGVPCALVFAGRQTRVARDQPLAHPRRILLEKQLRRWSAGEEIQAGVDDQAPIGHNAPVEMGGDQGGVRRELASDTGEYQTEGAQPAGWPQTSGIHEGCCRNVQGSRQVRESWHQGEFESPSGHQGSKPQLRFVAGRPATMGEACAGREAEDVSHSAPRNLQGRAGRGLQIRSRPARRLLPRPLLPHGPHEPRGDGEDAVETRGVPRQGGSHRLRPPPQHGGAVGRGASGAGQDAKVRRGFRRYGDRRPGGGVGPGHPAGR